MVPRHPGQQHAHAAGVGDAGEDQSGSDEGRQADRTPDGRTNRARPQQHQRPGGDANLPLQRDGLLAADDRQAGLDAGHGAALDVDDVREACLGNFSHACWPRLPGAANEVQRFVLASVAGLHHRRRVELIQGDVAGDVDVHLPELNRRAHVDEFDLLAFLAELGKFGGGNGGSAHDFLPRGQLTVLKNAVELSGPGIYVFR